MEIFTFSTQRARCFDKAYNFGKDLTREYLSIQVVEIVSVPAFLCGIVWFLLMFTFRPYFCCVNLFCFYLFQLIFICLIFHFLLLHSLCKPICILPTKSLCGSQLISHTGQGARLQDNIFLKFIIY